MAKRLLARIKTLRTALGLSQEAFAEKSGLGYKYYQSVEAGRKRDIRLSTLEKLAKGCGLELQELLDFSTDPVVLAEDRMKDGVQASARKGSRRAPRGRAGEKKGD
jgi:transcriptional regulator with XRE-family HTH domain